MTDLIPGLPGSHAAYLAWDDAAGDRQRLTFDLVVNEDWDSDVTVTEHPVEEGANVADHVRVELRTCKLTVFSTNEPIGDTYFLDGQDTTLALAAPRPMPQLEASTGVITYPQWRNNIDERNFAASAAGFLVGQTGAPAPVTDFVVDLVKAQIPPLEIEVVAQTDAKGIAKVTPGPWNATVRTYGEALDAVAAMHQLLEQLKDSAQVFDVFGSKTLCFNMVIESLSFTRSEDEGTGESITIGLKEVRIVTTQTVAAPIPALPAGGGKPTANKGEQNPQPKKLESVLKSPGGQQLLSTFTGGVL